jgi:arylsulfatase A-like enzyme
VTRITIPALTVLLAVGCTPGGEAPPRVTGPAPPPDVILITLDTFRADRAGCMGHPGGLTPVLDRVLRDGLLARTAFASAPLTAISHASLLSGLTPADHGVRDNATFPFPDSIPTLPEILARHDFRTAAVIAGFPLSSQFGFARGFDFFDEDLAPASGGSTYYAERPAGDVVAAALDLARKIPREDRLFLWAHFFDPHFPREPMPALAGFPAEDPYDLEIRGLDLELGRFLAAFSRLRERRPVLAIASDHGEALGGHGEMSHGVLLYQETMHALFGFHAPAGTPEGDRITRGIRKETARFEDLVPTLCDILSIPPPDGGAGHSLLNPEEPGRWAIGETYYPMFHYRWSPLLSARNERWTYVRAPVPELYDRRLDPGETRNLAAEYPEVVQEAESVLRAAESEPAFPGQTPQDDETREKLMALGYISGATGGEIRRNMNPAEMIGSVNALFRGITLYSKGRPDAALPYFRKAYQSDPGNVSAVYQLANCLRSVGETSVAISYYHMALRIDPRVGEAWAHLAFLSIEAGNADEAFRLIAEGLLHAPKSFALLMAAGDLHDEVGKPGEAEEYYRRVQSVEPDRPEPWEALARIAARQGRPADAATAWEEARKRNPALSRTLPERH